MHVVNPPNFAKRCFSTSPGCYSRPKRKQKQSYARFLGGGGADIVGPWLVIFCFFFENICNSVLLIEMQCTKILMRFRLHFVDVLRFRIHFDAFRPPVLTKSLSVFIENASIWKRSWKSGSKRKGVHIVFVWTVENASKWKRWPKISQARVFVWCL